MVVFIDIYWPLTKYIVLEQNVPAGLDGAKFIDLCLLRENTLTQYETELGPECLWRVVKQGHSTDFTQTKQQRPESPNVLLTWHASKYKVHKLNQTYILTVADI